MAKDAAKLAEVQLAKKREQARTSFEHDLRLVCRGVMPQRVLEWGPGSSTAMIAEECPGATILSVEHDKKWFDHQVGVLGKGRSKDVDEFGNVHLKVKDSEIILCHRIISMKGGQSNGYVTFPLYLKGVNAESVVPGIEEGFQLIFVDGRFRFDCQMISKHLLSLDGIVVVHDTQRVNYKIPWRLFKERVDDVKRRTTVLSDRPLDWIEKEEEPWWELKSDSDTLLDLERRFQSGQSFYYTRFGDADVYFIDDPCFNRNRRHQPKTPLFSRELKEAFTIDDPDFMIGCAAMDGWETPSKIRDLKRIVGKHYRNKTFWSAVALHQTFLSKFKMFKRFIKVFDGKRVGLVGGPTVCNSPEVRKVFNVSDSIVLSDTNAYELLDVKMPEIIDMAKNSDILISALGQTTRILAKRLWLLGIRDIQYFDIGSTVDALAGVKTRSWIKENLDIIEKNKESLLSD